MASSSASREQSDDKGSEYPLSLLLTNLKRPTAPEISTCTCLTVKEMAAAHMDNLYVPLAKKALAYYNAKQHSNLSFEKATVAASQTGPSSKKVHINFIATSEDGTEELLFSELVADTVKKSKSWHPDEYHVKGCSLLKAIESGNPIGSGCSMCRGVEVIHPGPRHGYLIVGGDSFEGYPFWGYRFPPTTAVPKPDHQKMYFACAMKALEYFNSKQSTSFKAVEVVGGCGFPCYHNTIVHVNFKCITSHTSEEGLFFAELVVPRFTVDYGIWDICKEPFIVVKGCCLLEKVDSGKPFGRVCEVCYSNEVIHPGPKDGYRVALGDDFTGYGFMTIGSGIY